MISKKQAKEFLRDVENAFFLNDGRILYSVEQLLNSLNDMSDETFKHHVNKEKNDFRNWIVDIIGDKRLGKDIAKSKSKNAIKRKISIRIRQLKKILK